MTTLKEGSKVIVLHTDDQVFCFTDSNDCEWHWNAGAGMRLVEASRRQPMTFFPSDHGLSVPYLQKQYPDLDLDYARTTDVTRPILFVPFYDGTSVLIDGWHRCARAVLEGIPFLLCYELTEAERDEVLVMKIPPRSKLAPMDTKKGPSGKKGRRKP
ncbi:hypothetical protein [Armatimonas sp.]|uniref:hypothetical protein n=1 Tax=Armatimonas sp. TaxID=1872638 RepID=UPI00286C6183|nr:hypothetical protein [Armatimonas sp.]